MALNIPLDPYPGAFSKTSLIQLGYGLWVNLSLVGIGLATGFSAVTIPQLSLPSSDIKVTLADEALITSVLTLASAFSCLVAGYLMDKFGRRPMLIASQLPSTVGWFYTACAKTSKDMIIGRIITGVGCGMAMTPPRAFVTEITLPNMRGVIGVFSNFALSSGITTQAALGSTMNWRTVSMLCGGYAIIVLLFNFYLPESPYYMLEAASAEEAKATLQKFRAKDYDIDSEMQELIEFKRTNNIHNLTFVEGIKALFKPSACKPFCIIFYYVILCQLVGTSFMMFYTVEILQESMSSIDPFTGNILIGASRICSGVMVSILLYKIGKRTLALTSSIGVGLVCVTLGGYLMQATTENIFAQICYTLYITFASMGYYSLPLLMMYELAPLQIRGSLGGIAVSVTNIFMFLSNTIFPYVKKTVTLPHTLIWCGVFSFLGTIYLYIYLPETKSVTLQEIEEYYNKRRPTLVSQRDVLQMQLKQSLSSTAALSMRRLSEKRRFDSSKLSAYTLSKHNKSLMKIDSSAGTSSVINIKKNDSKNKVTDPRKSVSSLKRDSNLSTKSNKSKRKSSTESSSPDKEGGKDETDKEKKKDKKKKTDEGE